MSASRGEVEHPGRQSRVDASDDNPRDPGIAVGDDDSAAVDVRHDRGLAPVRQVRSFDEEH
ncbi:hypothetical protein [Streptomyces sp. NBC_00076]|uniref:hypothetical protein n=1 Tax=Streptomyces sp. NBC_00076 TaxID=2975642 RepID=UPI00324AFB65